jgi:anti-sigma B factor antagonist
MTHEPTFHIRTDVVGDSLVIAVSGEVDVVSAKELGTAMERVFEQRAVIVDLREVTFLDSSGLGTIVRGQRILGERGISLQIVAPPAGIVRRVFEITRLIESIPIVDSLDQALL